MAFSQTKRCMMSNDDEVDATLVCQYLILTRPEDISFVRGSFSLFKMFIFFKSIFLPALVGKGIQGRPYFSQMLGTFDYELDFFTSFRKCGGVRGVVVCI